MQTVAKMIDPQSISEQIMYCTVRLLGVDAAGAPKSAGTGFIYNIPISENRTIPVLITNKHVVKDTPTQNFVVHAANAEGKPEGNGIASIALDAWVNHPDEKVDLCAAPFGQIANHTNPKPFFRALEPSLIPSQDTLEKLDAVEDIIMVGYPNGLWDEENNYPLIRHGITASHPAVDFNVGGVATTVIDCACFPGSSGSPVFIYNVGSYPAKGGALSIGMRCLFLGILFSGPIMTTDGKIIIRNIPTVAEPVAQVSMMINLGYIIKSRELEPLTRAVRERFNVPPP